MSIHSERLRVEQAKIDATERNRATHNWKGNTCKACGCRYYMDKARVACVGVKS